MLSKTTKIVLFSILLSACSVLHSQQWLGRTSGNYSGTYGIYNNASSISDSKYRYYFNFWGRGVNFYNDFLTYNAPVKLNHWANNNYSLQYRNANDKIDFQKDWLLESLDGNEKQFSFNQDIWGPAFMFPVSKRWNMSINTRQRSSFQIFGISEEVARMAHNGLDSSGGIYAGNNGLDRNVTYTNNAYSANIQSYQELSFTLGGILSQSEHHKLNGGATIKFLRGLGAAYVKGTGFGISATGDNSVDFNGNAEYAYTDDKSVTDPFNDPYGLFSLRSKGAGAGFDLGLNYTYSSRKLKYPSKSKCNYNDLRSDYDFKFAIALNDIGGIRYNRNSNKYDYSNNSNTPVNIPPGLLNGFSSGNQDGFDSIGQNIFAGIGATRSGSFNTALPTAINLQADFRLTKNIYTSILWNQSLKGNNSTGMRSTSLLSIIPRLESRGFEFSMPLTLSENYKNVYLGAYARIGPVFFGSDNLGGLLNVSANSQFTGADIYGGVSFGIGHCHSWWYDSKVDPVYMDSMNYDTTIQQFRDTVTIIKSDTVKIIRKDTVYIPVKGSKVIKRDTLYIEKIVKSKTDIEKENLLKRKEEELNRRQKDIDQRERDILAKEKGTYNENESLKNCKNTNTILETENNNLKTRIIQNEAEIVNLKKEITDLKRLKSLQDAEILAAKKCAEDKQKLEAEVVRLKNEILIANKKISELDLELIRLKTNSSKPEAEILTKTKRQLDSVNIVLIALRTELDKCNKNSSVNEAEIVKKAVADKTKAETDNLKLRKQNDSLGQIINLRLSELENCKKNASQFNAEIIRKAEADKTKAETEAKASRKTSDSLSIILGLKLTELENCKKNTSTQSAEIIKKLQDDKGKAEKDVIVARKQSDSLNEVLIAKTAELENCRKNSSTNSAEVVKKAEADKIKAEKEAKECSDKYELMKTELNLMSKNIGALNTKNYALTYKVDSLINELKNCSKSGTSDPALLKKCEDETNRLEAEIVTLKNALSRKDKSLDSFENEAAKTKKNISEADAEIVKMKAEITELKAKNSSTNCDDIQKQLDNKIIEFNTLKNDNSALQIKINNLNNQLSEYKTEYNFLVKQSQRCTQKLDSCMRGLYNTGGSKPEEGQGSGSGSGGPMEEGNNSDDSLGFSSIKKLEKAVSTGAQVINILMQSRTKTNGNSGSTGSGRTTETSSKTGTETRRGGNTTETGSGSSGGSGNDRNSSGTDNSTRRR